MLNLNTKKKQKKFNVTFRENEEEEKLYRWIEQKGKIGGVSNFIKTELNKIMEQEKKGK